MSNPSICYLIRNQVCGVYFAIEDNLGEAIHIHYGNTRFDMTICEFLAFSECIIDAAIELFKLRGLNWNSFSNGNFKVEWMYRYKYISNVRKRLVLLDDLYIKESFLKKRSIKKYIPIKESGYIPYLRGQSKDNAYYEEKGVYEPSRAQKVLKIKEMFQQKNNPDNEELILIDQEGYILDGVKRASCLYHLYGGDLQIPVLQIDICWEESLLKVFL